MATELNRPLSALFGVPRHERDSEWQDAFCLSAAGETCATDGKPVRGPDGFQYVQFSCVSAARDDQERRLTLNGELPGLLSQGAGAVFFAESDSAEWVFTYGDLLNLKLNHTFYSPLFAPKESEEFATQTTEVRVYQPSETYLPAQTRGLIRSWLEALGINNIRIQAMDYPQSGEVLKYLIFDFSQSGKTDEQLPDLLRGISWFLPRHYLVLGSNDPNEDRTTFEVL